MRAASFAANSYLVKLAISSLGSMFGWGCPACRCGHRETQHGLGMLTANRWKIVQEYLQRVTGCEVVEQSRDRHARAGEARRTPQAARIDGDERLWQRHD
jgi:hypothetical protein